MATVQCKKCGLSQPALEKPPFSPTTKLGPLGKEIQESICAPCYRQWIDMSVKLVNEMRLDMGDPRGQEIWLTQMRAFLNLDGAPADPWAALLNKRVRVETTGGTQTTATLIGLDAARANFAEFEGGTIPDGFVPSETGAHGSASIPREALKRVEPA